MRRIDIILSILLPLFLWSCLGAGRNAARNGESVKLSDSAETWSAHSKPVQYTYVVKAVYPHSTGAYTQGLYWHDGVLWEGTGLNGRSELRKVDLKSGKTLFSVPLDKSYFGEGIALLDGKIYQLTWQNGVAFVYDAETLEPAGEFHYDGEGWGLTTDGSVLYMSDGSSRLYKVDPAGFRRTGSVDVRLGGSRVNYLNELEWIDGKIWANVYTTDVIVIIDPTTGTVEGVVDLTGLLPESDRNPDTDVLNGIAYDAATKRIFVTGKNWDKLFEIELKKKEE